MCVLLKCFVMTKEMSHETDCQFVLWNCLIYKSMPI